LSVYRPQRSAYYHYDFWVDGQRYCGSTRTRVLAQARRIEAEMLRAALAPDRRRMTLAAAAEAWWADHAQHLKSAPQIRRRLDQLVALIGAETWLDEIDFARVQGAIAARRRQGPRRGARGRLAARTLNLDVVGTLRPLLRWAAAMGVETAPIGWAQLRLPEPQRTPRALPADALARLVEAAGPDWADFIRFLATYGCRLSEAFFTPGDLEVAEPDDARLHLRDRKGGDEHVLPLLPADARWLAALKAAADAAGLATIWARRTRSGELAPLTYPAAQSAIRRAMRRAGLNPLGFTSAHDLRRHAAVRTLRATGNLRVVQRLLGHRSYASTLRYSDGDEHDLRAALALSAAVRPADGQLAA
jgi:site-specific recombinase XerC